MSKKLKYFYGNLLHYQMKRIFLATKIQNNRYEDSFFFNLERRLEVIFYRMGFLSLYGMSVNLLSKGWYRLIIKL